jgi:hypothetical protein
MLMNSHANRHLVDITDDMTKNDSIKFDGMMIDFLADYPIV